MSAFVVRGSTTTTTMVGIEDESNNPLGDEKNEEGAEGPNVGRQNKTWSEKIAHIATRQSWIFARCW